MASAAVKKGTSWAQACVLALRGVHPGAERRALAGRYDLGDVVGVPGWTIEAKADRTYNWSAWMEEARAEARNARTPYWCVWAHRKGRHSVLEGYVVMNGDTFLAVLRAMEGGSHREPEAEARQEDTLPGMPAVGTNDWRRPS